MTIPPHSKAQSNTSPAGNGNSPDGTNDSSEADTSERESRIAVRAAFMHFVDLVTAFDGRGVPGVPDPEAIQRDRACLEQVVELLLRHRDQVLKRSKKAVAEELVTLLTPVYRDHLVRKKATRADLAKHVRAVLDARGVEYPARWIEVLAPERFLFKANDKHKEGAVATARYLVCERLLTMSASSLSPSKRSPWIVEHQVPSMFGVRPSAAMAARHARQVLEWTPPPGHGEATIAWLRKHNDDRMRAAIESLKATIAAAAASLDNRVPSIEDVPFLRPYANVHPATRQQLMTAFAQSFSRLGVDAAALADIASDDRTADLVDELLKIFDGETAEPLR